MSRSVTKLPRKVERQIRGQYRRVHRNEDKPHRCPECHKVCCRAGWVRRRWHRCHDCVVTWWGGWR